MVSLLRKLHVSRTNTRSPFFACFRHQGPQPRRVAATRCLPNDLSRQGDGFGPPTGLCKRLNPQYVGFGQKRATGRKSAVGAELAQRLGRTALPDRLASLVEQRHLLRK
jgi:hypothetical protein